MFLSFDYYSLNHKELGRAGSRWQSNVVNEPLDRFLNDLALKDFSGIYINREGYEDGAGELEQELTALLNKQPVNNDRNTLLFFDMTGYANQRRP